MKTFYRVEHGVDKCLRKYYLGMYKSSVARDQMSGMQHPTPREDEGLKVSLGQDVDDFLDCLPQPYIFAFPDLPRLRTWVYNRKWLKELDRLGYVLSVYECDDGYHGDTQSIFNWEKAQLKHRLNLLEV